MRATCPPLAEAVRLIASTTSASLSVHHDATEDRRTLTVVQLACSVSCGVVSCNSRSKKGVQVVVNYARLPVATGLREERLENWDCYFCRALNADDVQACWKCHQTRAASDQKWGIKNADAEAKLKVADDARNQALSQLAKAQESARDLSASSQLDLRSHLMQFVGATIGINLKDPVKTHVAILSSAQADHFAVQTDALTVRIPYTQILRVSEVPAANPSDGNSIIIEVFHLVVYKGSVGFGLSLPF